MKKNPSVKTFKVLVDEIVKDMKDGNTKAAKEAAMFLDKRIKHYPKDEQDKVMKMLKDAITKVPMDPRAGKTRDDLRKYRAEAIDEIISGKDAERVAKKYGFKSFYSLKNEAERVKKDRALDKLIIAGKTNNQLEKLGYDQSEINSRLRHFHHTDQNHKGIKAKFVRYISYKSNPEKLPTLEFDEVE